MPSPSEQRSEDYETILSLSREVGRLSACVQIIDISARAFVDTYGEPRGFASVREALDQAVEVAAEIG